LKIGYIIIDSKKFELHGRYSWEEGLVLEIKDLMPGHFKMLMKDWRFAIEHIELDKEALLEFLENAHIQKAKDIEKFGGDKN